jgi:hypothetical protein
MGQLGMRDHLGPDTHFSYHGQGGYWQQLTEEILGVGFGTILKGSSAIGGISNLITEKQGLAGVSSQQLKAWRRIAPYQNLFYIDFLFDAMENGVVSAGKRQKRQRYFQELAGLE